MVFKTPCLEKCFTMNLSWQITILDTVAKPQFRKISLYLKRFPRISYQLITVVQIENVHSTPLISKIIPDLISQLDITPCLAIRANSPNRHNKKIADGKLSKQPMITEETTVKKFKQFLNTDNQSLTLSLSVVSNPNINKTEITEVYLLPKLLK